VAIWLFAGPAVAGTEVVVAARDLAPGEVVTAKDVSSIAAPPDAWPLWGVGGLRAPAQAVGATVRERVLAGEVLHPARLGVPDPARAPAPGHFGVMVVGTPAGAVVDLVSPALEGCRLLSGAPVLRWGGGVVLVEVPLAEARAVLAGSVGLAEPGGNARKCRDTPPPRPARVPIAPVAAERRQVAVAARDLAAGAVLAPADVVFVQLRPELVPSTAEPAPIGATLREAVHRGEVLRGERLASPAAPGGAPRPAGPPAVVGDVTGAPWWPGDRVGVVTVDGCLGLEGEVAGSLDARAADLAVPLSPGDVALSAPWTAPAGVLVALPPPGADGGWCRGPAGAPLSAAALVSGGPTASLRVFDAANAPATDAVVRYGRRAGAWDGELRPDAEGAVAVPIGGPQLWLRVEREGSEPAVLGQRVDPAGSTSVGITLGPAGSCPQTPSPAAWPSVTKAGYWTSAWQLPDRATAPWTRLEVDGGLVEGRLLVSIVQAADGGADLEVRGSGFGGGSGARHLAPDAWSALRSTLAAAREVPAALGPPRPAPHCDGGTRFRLEIGDEARVTGFYRRGVAPGSVEDGAVRAVLVAAGLDPDG
jgi:flagella basal body P-ring formation protein FlgA